MLINSVNLVSMRIVVSCFIFFIFLLFPVSLNRENGRVDHSTCLVGLSSSIWGKYILLLDWNISLSNSFPFWSVSALMISKFLFGQTGKLSLISCVFLCKLKPQLCFLFADPYANIIANLDGKDIFQRSYRLSKLKFLKIESFHRLISIRKCKNEQKLLSTPQDTKDWWQESFRERRDMWMDFLRVDTKICVSHVRCSWRVSAEDKSVGKNDMLMNVSQAFSRDPHSVGGRQKISIKQGWRLFIWA